MRLLHIWVTFDMTSHNKPDPFSGLLSSLPQPQLRLYQRLKHTRSEAGFAKRQFIVYTFDRDVEVKDVLTIRHLDASSEDGAWTTIHSRKLDRETMVDYKPTQLWDYKALVWLPLHFRLRWDIDETGVGTLGFPLVIRTLSRYNLRESGVDYVESMHSFYEEFGNRKLEI